MSPDFPSGVWGGGGGAGGRLGRPWTPWGEESRDLPWSGLKCRIVNQCLGLFQTLLRQPDPVCGKVCVPVPAKAAHTVRGPQGCGPTAPVLSPCCLPGTTPEAGAPSCRAPSGSGPFPDLVPFTASLLLSVASPCTPKGCTGPFSWVHFWTPRCLLGSEAPTFYAGPWVHVLTRQGGRGGTSPQSEAV